MKKGLIAITFPDINGATQMLDTLNKSIKGDLTQLGSILIIEKDKHDNLKVKKSTKSANGTSSCCELNFVVGILLRGEVANDLFGPAAGTLLIRHMDFGISPETVTLLTKDIVVDSSVLFMQDCSRLNGTFEAAFNQSNGRLYDLSMSQPAIQEVQIMSSTLNHYWN